MNNNIYEYLVARACNGHGENDVMEFTNFKGKEETYTNKDFYKFMHPWNEELLLDLCKIRINCIVRLDKDYVELWIRTIARGIGTSPIPYLKDQMSFPPDIVDDTQEHLDDTYVEALKKVGSAQEEMVSEDPEYEDEDFYYDENVLE